MGDVEIPLGFFIKKHAGPREGVSGKSGRKTFIIAIVPEFHIRRIYNIEAKGGRGVSRTARDFV